MKMFLFRERLKPLTAPSPDMVCLSNDYTLYSYRLLFYAETEEATIESSFNNFFDW